jgi:hypothetical protein
VGGGSKKPTQRVADYLMSMHFGVCYQADSIERISVNDKVVFEGRVETNQSLWINLPDLFGGNKKEGGARGLIQVLMGGAAQLLPEGLAAKLGGSPDSVPGYRGLTSLFFTGGGPESAAGFMWTSNTAYLRPVDATVRRAPKGFYPEKALIGSEPDNSARVQAVFSHTTPFTSAFGDASFPPRPYSILPSTFTYSLPQWSTSFPPSAAWKSYQVSSSGYSESNLVPVTGGTGRPPNGSTDESDGRFVRPPLGLNAAANSTGCIQQRNGVIAAIGVTPADMSVLYRWQIGTLSPIMIPRGNLRTFALSADGSYVYAMSTTTIYCYNENLDIIAQRTIPVPIASSEFPLPNSRGWVDGDNVYFTDFGANTTTRLLAFRASDLTFVDQFTLPLPPGTGGYYNIEFRVFGDLYYRASTTVGMSGSLYSECFRLLPWKYGRYDANPAHIIYECLTNDDWGLGLPTNQIDTDAFILAADTLYAENLGLSMMWSSQSTIESFINDVLGHIDGTYGIDPATGRIYLQLIRGGYDLDELFELNDDNCKITRMQRKSLSETVNEAVVTWTNPVNEKEETVAVHDLANYSLQGKLNSNSSNYYGVRSGALALRLAMRDLTRAAYPVASLELDADRSAWRLKPGDVVLVSSIEYGITRLPLRVTSVDSGRPGAGKVSISGLEDVFQLPSGAYVENPPSEWVDQISTPADLKYFMGITAPYYFVSRELGSSEAASRPVGDVTLLSLGADDSFGVTGFQLAEPVVTAAGSTSFVVGAGYGLTSRAQLTSALVKEATSVGVTIGSLSSGAAIGVGSLAWIGGSDGKLAELCVVTRAGGSLNLTRGVLDTNIREWPVGTPVWFPAADLSSSDQVTRLSGEAVRYKAITVTESGVLDPTLALVRNVTADNRPHLPYRPANVKLNGVYWPALVEGNIELSWSRRNRLQEEPVVLTWTAGDVTPESDQTVTARLLRVDTNAILTSASAVTGTSATLTAAYSGTVRLELTSVRGGLESYQPFTHTFELISYETRITEAGETRITESGETRILES